MDRQVLVPVDGSPLSEAALEFALTELSDSSVTVLHVQDPADAAYGEPVDLPVAEPSAERSPDTSERIEVVTDRVFETVRDIADAHDAHVDTETALGDPSREIEDYVATHDVDHVVMGSHGRTGMERLILGSVSSNVVRRCPVTVTVIRE